MWNSFDTANPPTISTETVTITGALGDPVLAYVARPNGTGPFPGVVAVHHMPGWDEFYQEFARRLANHGYVTIAPDLYGRQGHGTPDDVAAKVRASGGVADDQVLGDMTAAARWLRSRSDSNGKVGIVGSCSGGRQALMVASRSNDFDAVIDLWGGGVVAPKESLTAKQPVAPIDYTSDLKAPLLGIFGNDDQRPSPAEVDTHEAELKRHGKEYEFHRYTGAGHGFFYYDRPMYRQQQAMDGWNKVFDFFKKHLNG